MKVLLINGSPRGEKSNTLKLARAFASGLGETIQQVNLKEKSINHCTGCFSCWSKTPGKCVLKDDMPSLLEDFIRADLVIWSFPLYYFGMPSLVKAFMDRLLPLNHPHMETREDGSSYHPTRYNLSAQKHVLISTCGFPDRKDNFEALSKQFEIFSGSEMVQILCPEGELFSIEALKGKTDAYLTHVEKGGREFAQSGCLSHETSNALEALLVPVGNFKEMANAHWELLESPSASPEKREDKEKQAELFLRQMAACYNPEGLSSPKEELVLEMAFSDPDCTFQLVGDKEICRVEKGISRPCTTRIETSYKNWRDISEGKLQGAQAMMDGLYKVKGDFAVMNSMDVLFGGKVPTPPHSGKKTNMNILLIPWIALWVFLPINPLWGGIAGVLGCTLTALGGFRYKLTGWDRIGQSAVLLLSLIALLGIGGMYLPSLSYLIFGLMWFLSARGKVPLSACYSSEKFGGESALENPLFLKTNRMITDGWGILYLLMAPIAWLLLQSPFKAYTGLINQIGPLLMGIFTAWFQKWYPRRVAC
jgi:multimeric flavodoxin WrbA/putative sterol carrier protein